MEYADPYPSSVPHAILLPHNFTLSSMFYGCSMVLEIYFLSVCAISVAFALYFCIGNHKLLIDQSGNQNQKKDKQNIICEVVARTNFLDKEEDEQSESMSQKSKKHDEQTNRTSLQSELMAGQFRIYERRFVYATSFTIPWAICVNSFDASIIVIICGAVFMGLVLLFNIRRMLPEWKISLLVYFVPALAAMFPYIGGTHQLYAWTQVKDPLQLQI